MAEKMILEYIEESEEQRKPIELVLPDVTTLNEVFSVRITTETRKSLEALAKKYKMSMSEVVRQLAEQGIELVNRKK